MAVLVSNNIFSRPLPQLDQFNDPSTDFEKTLTSFLSNLEASKIDSSSLTSLHTTLKQVNLPQSKTPLFQKISIHVADLFIVKNLDSTKKLIKQLNQENEKSVPILIEILEIIVLHGNLDKTTQDNLENIIIRYQQIFDIENQSLGLNEKQVLKLAIFIEILLPKIAGTTKIYFKKEDYDVSRSLARNLQTNDLYLLSKRHVDILNAEGTSKTVTSAIYLPPLNTKNIASLMAQSVTKNGSTQSMIRDAQRECLIHQELNGATGIWPIHFSFQYMKRVCPQLKVSSITAYADGDLDSVLGQLTLQELIQVAHQLIQGLEFMHRKGYAHADLKLENGLIRRENEVIISGLTDFGFSFKPSVDKSPTVLGDYGNRYATPPERYGKIFSTQAYFKADVWALGLMFYELYFNEEELPWENLIPRYGPFKKSKAMDDILKKSIEEPLATFQKQASLSKDDDFQCLIYQMMRVNPADRIDAKTALERIQSISNQ